MNAEILSIGDELLIGQVVNTNASWLGEQLNQLGITVRRVTTVGDDHDGVLAAFSRAWEEQDLVLVTGGLGPTHDDVTRAAVCDFFDTDLIRDNDVLADIESFFSERRRPLTDVNRDQAMVPAAARTIRNPNGTAPGYHFTRGGKHFFAMPGVPYEMHGMVERDILPLLRASFDGVRLSHTILTTGIPESTLSELLRGIETHIPDTRVAYLPSPAGVRIRLTALARQKETGHAALETLRRFVQDRASEYIFGSGMEALESVVGTMLAASGNTLAVAESCTGGLITDRITNVPGSSTWFERGIVCYSNQSKTDMLGVTAQLIDTHGAVSREVAEAMAEGIRRISGCTIGISTTGIAGPSGGSVAKPVGLVWIALSTDSKLVSHPFYFGDHRMRTKQRASQAAVDMVRRALLDLPPIPSNLTEAT